MVWLYYRIMGNNLSVVVVYCVFYGMEAASIHNFNYCYRHEFAFYFFCDGLLFLDIQIRSSGKDHVRFPCECFPLCVGNV